MLQVVGVEGERVETLIEEVEDLVMVVVLVQGLLVYRVQKVAGATVVVVGKAIVGDLV